MQISQRILKYKKLKKLKFTTYKVKKNKMDIKNILLKVKLLLKEIYLKKKSIKSQHQDVI